MGSKQSTPSECLSLCFVFRKFKRSYDVRQNLLFTWVYNINIIYVRWIFWIYNSAFNIRTCSGYQYTHLFEQTYPHCILWLRCTGLQDRNSYLHRIARILKLGIYVYNLCRCSQVGTLRDKTALLFNTSLRFKRIKFITFLFFKLLAFRKLKQI